PLAGSGVGGAGQGGQGGVHAGRVADGQAAAVDADAVVVVGELDGGAGLDDQPAGAVAGRVTGAVEVEGAAHGDGQPGGDGQDGGLAGWGLHADVAADGVATQAGEVGQGEVGGEGA